MLKIDLTTCLRVGSILPLPSFAMLILGTYAVSLLAAHWDLEPDPNDED